MITIQQLLESVDLNFEPRWVTKDGNGEITIYAEKPIPERVENLWNNLTFDYKTFGTIKLAEFSDKPWQECIYEVPRKTTGKIEKLTEASIGKDGDVPSLTSTVNVLNVIINRLNQVIDAVNE